MNVILFVSLLVISINQSFACECGGHLTRYITDIKSYKGKLSRFQWYAAVLVKDRDSCGSALLDDQHVATAANCVAGLDAKSITVQLNDKSSKTVSSVWVDKRYDNVTGAYDFAILTLSSPVDSQFTPVCLKIKLPFHERLLVRVSPSVPYSLESYIERYSNARCNDEATDTHLCGINYGTETSKCQIGPIASFEDNSSYFLTGITSRCGHNEQAVYTDVDQYDETIKQLAPNACWKRGYNFYSN